jgi:hypothetical protein
LYGAMIDHRNKQKVVASISEHYPLSEKETSFP